MNDDDAVEEKKKRKSQTTQLIELTDGLTLFHDGDGVAYAEIPINQHIEVWPIRSRVFRDWLSNQYYMGALTGCSRNSLTDAKHHRG